MPNYNSRRPKSKFVINKFFVTSTKMLVIVNIFIKRPLKWNLVFFHWPQLATTNPLRGSVLRDRSGYMWSLDEKLFTECIYSPQYTVKVMFRNSGNLCNN